MHYRATPNARRRRLLYPLAGATRLRVNAAAYYAALLVAPPSWRRVCVRSSVRSMRSRSLLEPKPPHVAKTTFRRQFILPSVHRHRQRARLPFTRRLPKIHPVDNDWPHRLGRQLKINAPTPSRTLCTMNIFRVTASRNKPL